MHPLGLVVTTLQTFFDTRRKERHLRAIAQKRWQDHSTATPRDQARRNMVLLKYELLVDAQGRFWGQETRHCLRTGLIIRETRRLTD